MDDKKEAKEKLKRALRALNAPEEQMSELVEEFRGLPTDKNLSLGQRLAWIKQRIGPRGSILRKLHLAPNKVR